MNRLADEASPYLQQHAKNPVDWYPWGEEALALARSTDRPILLSIGYSACHWCHVMERESFEDEATAKLMNELFVCIKVDREERPDLDNVYQLAVQILGRSGGWPLTAFLAPDAKPFFAGTYFPPKEQYGMPGFPDVLKAVAEGYKTQREEIADQAQKMTHAVRTITRVAARPPRGVAGEYVVLGPDLLEVASAKLGARFDDLNGGFGDRPKFPNTMPLSILLRRGVLEKDATAVTRFRRATEAMRDGGVHDQIGGGFHRYSTDAKWLVPHFEKMLYDNALLLRLYTDAWRCFGDADDRAAAEGIVAYVAREMTDADGAFFATQDADSEGEEGRFFIWTKEQISVALANDVEARDAALTAYGVTGKGNFDESSVAGATVLARGVGVDAAALGRARTKLFALRETREKPFRDEKVIAGWNALMIGALADASAALGEPTWLARAEAAFLAVESRLVSVDAAGTLRVQRLYMRRGETDVVRGPGFLDDYAYLAAAALDLYEVTGAPKYAATARKLADAVVARFAGETAGDGFYFTPSDGETLILRSSDSFDQAVPNASAVAADVLLKLGTMVDPAYATRATAFLEKLVTAAAENPLGLGQTVLALDRMVRGSIDVVLVGKKGDLRLAALAHEALSAYVPTRNVAWVDPGNPESREVCAALAAGKEKTEGPLAYVCRGRTCSAPINSPAELAKELLGDDSATG